MPHLDKQIDVIVDTVFIAYEAGKPEGYKDENWGKLVAAFKQESGKNSLGDMVQVLDRDGKEGLRKYLVDMVKNEDTIDLAQAIFNSVKVARVEKAEDLVINLKSDAATEVVTAIAVKSESNLAKGLVVVQYQGAVPRIDPDLSVFARPVITDVINANTAATLEGNQTAGRLMRSLVSDPTTPIVVGLNDPRTLAEQAATSQPTAPVQTKGHVAINP